MNKVKEYRHCATRLELRGELPPTRAWVDHVVQSVAELKIEAVVGSAVDNHCRPLFPSRIYPHCHADANREIFHYWIDALHAIGRPILSWLAINHCVGLLEDHPEWQIQPIPDAQGRRPEADAPYYACINSPYGERLPMFCGEVIRELGFDGIWFDGSSLSVNNNTIPGCVCGFCRRRFHDDTGRELPERIDWQSDAFRAWINWRYDRLMAVWKCCLDAIHAVNPAATVCFNNYRRVRYGGIAWGTGIPLRKLGWDALMSGELDLQVFHADFQMKMHRMYGCTNGQDTWLALCDHWQMWVPDVELMPIRHAAISAVSAGGVMWMGTGVDPLLNPPICRTAQETTAPLMEYLEGDTLEYAAIWASQQTQDFYWQDRPQGAWDGWHGANELCLLSHLQSSLVFDDHVADGDIVGRYPVLLAGNTACVSEKQAAILRWFVEEGGVLVACADFATRDDMGRPHAYPILDDLLGITARRPGTGRPTLEIIIPALLERSGKWLTCPSRHVLATPTSDVQLIAQVVDMNGTDSWDGYERNSINPLTRHPGAWIVRRGRGKVVYIGADLFLAHQQAPKTMQVEFFRALLTSQVLPEITLTAPLQVTMNTRRRKDGSIIVHLHNAPGSLWRHSQASNGADVMPVYDLQLQIRDGGIRSAHSGLSGMEFDILDNGTWVSVPELRYNDVVVLNAVSH